MCWERTRRYAGDWVGAMVGLMLVGEAGTVCCARDWAAVGRMEEDVPARTR